MTDVGFARPSALPGWSRAHLVAHVARDADALVNLLNWARTGVDSSMYASADQRAREIEEDARRRPEDLRAELLAADGRAGPTLRSWSSNATAPTTPSASEGLLRRRTRRHRRRRPRAQRGAGEARPALGRHRGPGARRTRTRRRNGHGRRGAQDPAQPVAGTRPLRGRGDAFPARGTRPCRTGRLRPGGRVRRRPQPLPYPLRR
ncbi:maleylpyruvate isomerase N-terminal domain-containing protein [Streptomyces sp. 5-6(2022)]|uniref:maleylpyruvate isomerase N-terminal domain-containing protein n=1 Tax=Streptomyces sp. 5-6(2022) TaxID=2936510 RepID=UPI0023B9A8DD|nr:maleylpyruvate isomerase N-terminal domain-containing protein [Streptomyces sp. 5-6(2022)]